MATVACTAQDLVTSAKCIFPCIPIGLSKYVKLALLCAAVNSQTMDCSAQNLVNQALCLQTCIPPGMVDAVEIALLCALVNNIAAGGGGGGASGAVTCAQAADPVAASTTTCALFYRVDNGSVWIWNAGAAAWNKILG